MLMMSCKVFAALETIDFQLRWHHQFQFAGYYAAVEKGFYQEVGLDVRIHAAGPGVKPIEEVLAGRAQYAEANSELLYAKMQGRPLVALAAIFQHSPSVLLTRKDANINSPHDLIGKKVMLNSGTDSDFLAMFLREGIGIKPNLIDILPSSFDFEDLISGRVDAFNSYLTNEPFYMMQKGIDYTVINPSTYGIDFYSDILFTSEQELKQNPKRVAAFRQASLKGWRYAMDHPDEIIDLLVNKYQVEKSREHLQFEANAMRKLILPDLVEIGHMNPGRWRRMADAFIDVGMGDKDFALDDFLYDSGNSPEQVQQLKQTIVIETLIGGILLLLGVVFCFGWLSLRSELARRKISEAMRLQAANAEVEKERWLRSELNRFMSMLGHELKTPLAVIDTTVQSLELQPGAELPALASRHERIRQAINRLDSLINDVLARDRLDAAVWKTHSQVWPISSLIDAVLSTYGHRSSEDIDYGEQVFELNMLNSHCRLVINAENYWASGYGDLQLLQVAINNLIDNAVKYGDVNGVIKLDFKIINPSILRISVANKSDRLTKLQLTNIFDKYSRIGENNEVAGAGLGLYLVKHIINLHRGSIRAISLPNRWLCFVIKVPLKINSELNDEY
jgi:ABC-type nitrate/sulfonate/bicarbonate transport system substrate-binding protein